MKFIQFIVFLLILVHPLYFLAEKNNWTQKVLTAYFASYHSLLQKNPAYAQARSHDMTEKDGVHFYKGEIHLSTNEPIIIINTHFKDWIIHNNQLDEIKSEVKKHPRLRLSTWLPLDEHTSVEKTPGEYVLHVLTQIPKKDFETEKLHYMENNPLPPLEQQTPDFRKEIALYSLLSPF